MYGNVHEVAALPTAYGLPPGGGGGGGGAYGNVQQVAALPTAYGMPPQADTQNDVYSAAVMPTVASLPGDTGYGGYGGGYAPMNAGQGGYAPTSGGQGYGSMDGYALANGAQGVYGAAVMPTLQSLPAEGAHGGYGGQPAAWSKSQQADPMRRSWDGGGSSPYAGGGGQYAPVPGAQLDPYYGGTPWKPGSETAWRPKFEQGGSMGPGPAPGYDPYNSYGGCPGSYGTHPGLDMYSGILSSAPPSAMQTQAVPFQSNMSSGYGGSGTIGGKKKRRKKKCFCC